MSGYMGMRWLKCDLHMQTPADSRHWEGPPLTKGQEAVAAQAFAQACFEAGLDVIAITDHNFLSKDFLPHLQAAFDKLEEQHGHHVTIFPGFEVEVDVGKGMHVLALFEPGTTPNEIDHILTECGVGMPRIANGTLAKSTMRLPEVLQIVQRQRDDRHCRGVVIVPHVFEDSLFDNDRISEWLQKLEYQNPELLAVEVPRPVRNMSAGWQKLFGNGDDCQPDWKRIRPIATLMSSDNKCLRENDSDGSPRSNSIGWRYSWIKMSRPSIESLRQAFLDPDSRVVLPEKVGSDQNPSLRIRQGWIEAISIKNARFLADQEICFSRSLNCIIGGRGSGKSTILEYLRLLFRRADGAEIDEDTVERIRRVRDTLGPDAEVVVSWSSADGVADKFRWTNGTSSVVGRELADADTFFASLPVQFFSQQQLNRLTQARASDQGPRQAQRLLELIDGFAARELAEIARLEARQRQLVLDSFDNARRANEAEDEVRRLRQEENELERQWQAHSEIQDEARRHELLLAERRFVEAAIDGSRQWVLEFASQVDRLKAARVRQVQSEWPHAKWLAQFEARLERADAALANGIRALLESHRESLVRATEDDTSFQSMQQTLGEADEAFKLACEAKGLSPSDVGRLQEIADLRSERLSQIASVSSRRDELLEAAGDSMAILSELHALWRKQHEVRRAAAERANELASLGQGSQRFLDVSVRYQQDRRSFEELWEELGPRDGRTRLGRNWMDVGKELLAEFVRGEAESPWELLQARLDGTIAGSVGTLGELLEELRSHLGRSSELWQRTRCSRVQDAIDMSLFRVDGTVAGSIADGSLSDGQRNTAALALLLAQDGGPLVIDQPEDELDSNFLFSELIPMLRRVKNGRQLIMATHNANLPVNGDAQLVYALEARNGKGAQLAQGGLDCEEVTQAVLDIMEGSAEAFRRRREKYHY